MRVDTRVLPDPDALFRAAAEKFVDAAQEAAAARGVFRVALSGGQTPRGVYALLAGEGTSGTAVPWDRTHVFWGDERHVPPDHPDSNYRMANETLLARVPIPAANVHRIRAETPDARDAADDYERTLRKEFQLSQGGLPRFDLVFLGLGSDGHTASLFPGTPALLETRRLAVATRVEKLQDDRITLTPPVFNNAACVTFLVTGEDKAAALQAVLEGPRAPQRLPAQLIQPGSGRLLFLVDDAAASRLQARP